MRFSSKMKALAGCCALLLLATTAQTHAQGEAHGKHYTKADVDRVIRRVEERSDAFRNAMDRALDRGVLDGTEREDRINEQVKELENAIDRLRSEFDRSDTWQQTRSEVQKVMNEADEVNAIMNNRRRIGRNVRAGWTLVRRDLNTLADVYGLRQLR